MNARIPPLIAAPSVVLAASLLALGACSGDEAPLSPEVPPVALATVSPPGGATGVDPHAPVLVTFDGPMMAGMEAYAMLHIGDVTGPEIEGVWSLSPDRLSLGFVPHLPLEPHTGYTLHLGGGMMDAQGHYADLERHGPGMGGAWATSGMMGGGGTGGMGGTMGGTMGGGMGGTMGGAHMGEGWQHPENGTYGMVFSFTTGA
ncbi:MAG: Ig-like domain-containing protein [Longimicrobiales bacterium]|nr:Ig-like domain-containing protein [Longimicrobiales bacterium]